MVRKRKPSSIRVLEGNRGHRPIPEELKVQSGEVICPSCLSKRAKEEWHRLAPELIRLGLLTSLDRENFSSYCRGVAKLEEWEAILKKEGSMLTGPDGKRTVHPLIGAIDKRETQQRQYSAMFGLDASSRAGFPAVESQEPDQFEQWLSKKQSRRNVH